MRLDEFLSESQREGKLDSEGAFDISRQKALQKVASPGDHCVVMHALVIIVWLCMRW